ncbi:BrnA antitoxin family protein [Pseudoroseomonas wenyumeiae]
MSLRLDADLVRVLRDSGPGWQSRVNDTLRKAVLGKLG